MKKKERKLQEKIVRRHDPDPDVDLQAAAEVRAEVERREAAAGLAPEVTDAREAARALGFKDIPGGSVTDTMSDLTVRQRKDATVDALAGSDAVGDADEIAEFDTITDSNTLSSAATIAGAFDPFEKAEGAHDRDQRSAATNEELETDEVRAIPPSSTPGLGMTDRPDDETVADYVRAEIHDRRRELRRAKRKGSAEPHP